MRSRFSFYLLIILGFVAAMIPMFIVFGINSIREKDPSKNLTRSVPEMNGFVNDTANIMSEEEIESLETLLAENRKNTSNEIAVLTVSSLLGSDIESYSLKVASLWQLGKKDKDNGVLLLIAPKDHKLRIEVGYGLESTLTDENCGLIIRNVISPCFKNNEYSKGIIEGIKAIIAVAGGDVQGIKPTVDSTEKEKQGGIPLWLIILLVVLIILGLIVTFLDSDSDGYTSSSYSSRSSSSHSGGGGSFGGGGASGSW